MQVPNNGIPLPTVCGRAPLAPTSLTVVDTVPGSGRLWFTWGKSIDQDGGEQDVLQYILYRRLQGATTWSDPLWWSAHERNKSSLLRGDLGTTRRALPTHSGSPRRIARRNESTITTINVTPACP